MVKNLPAHTGDMEDLDLIPGLGKSFGEGNDSHFSILALEILMNGGSQEATDCGIGHNLAIKQQQQQFFYLLTDELINHVCTYLPEKRKKNKNNFEILAQSSYKNHAG